jgi:hypothetical protein
MITYTLKHKRIARKMERYYGNLHLFFIHINIIKIQFEINIWIIFLLGREYTGNINLL